MLPTITGVIARRVLVNFRADPSEVEALLPAGMRIRVVNGFALVGVCIIRFAKLRPLGFPAFTGMSSDNAAFRISTEWDHGDAIRTGVFVTQRVTSSSLIKITGGRLFPGVHVGGQFTCEESPEAVSIHIDIPDQSAIRLIGHVSSEWQSEVFASHHDASQYFRNDKIGYSPKAKGCACEGIELECLDWETSILATSTVDVAYFSERFPSAEFDHALLMHDIDHKWHSAPEFSSDT